MANDVLRSNLIIGTQINKPSKDNGFASINASLTNIEKRLDRLVSKPWVIKLELDRSAIDKLDPNAYNRKSPRTGGGAGGPGQGGGSTVVRPSPGGRQISQQITTDVKTGIQTGVETSARVQGQNLNTFKEIEKTGEGVVKTQEKSVDLLNQQQTAAEAQAVKQDRLAKLAREQARQYQAQGFALSKVSKEYDPLTGKTRRVMEYIKASGDSLENLRVRVARVSDKTGKSKEFDVFGSRALQFAPDIAAAEKQQAAIAAKADSNARRARKIERDQYVKEEAEKRAAVVRAQEELDRTIAANAKRARAVERADYVKEVQEKQRQVEKAQAELDRVVASNASRARKMERDQYVKEHQDAAKKVKKEEDDLLKKQANTSRRARLMEVNQYVTDYFNALKKQQQAEDAIERTKASNARKARKMERDAEVKPYLDAEATARRTARAARRQERQEFLAEERANRVREGVKAAEGAGFRRFGTTTSFDPMSGRITETTTLARVGGNALKGYTIEVLRANEATGMVTRQVLTGTQAFKFLGDSISRATVKVGMWAVATSAIFAVIQGLKAGAQAMNELEMNSILLARVGRTLVSTGNDEEASFKRRLKAAQELTQGIIELTTQIGGNAAESQRAAAIFLRTGQTQEEVLQSVRAALIASRIAEIGVEDAAKLLSSALLQFNLKARDLLPTLDSLNSLSNHYRVTTNDLLQSISRTGSVIGEHGGRLTELAAITAIVSQRTAQTGAVIGNAFKTIQSQLDRTDIRKDLFSKLKVSTVNFDGSSKSLSETLLELQSRIGALSQAEQKELTVQIAGIRQRNLFVAAINDAHKAIVAENRALFDSNSATNEFVDSSNSMEGTLKRLQATLIQTVTTTAGPLHTMVKDMLEVVNGALAIGNAFGSTTLGKIAIYASTILVLSSAVDYLVGKFGLATAAAAAWNAMTLANIRTGGLAALANLKQVFSLQALSVAYKFVTTAAVMARVATAAFSAVATVGILLLVSAFASASRAANVYKKSFDSQIEASERFIANEHKKQQAIRNTTRSLAIIIAEMDRLRRKGGDGAAQQIAELEQRAKQVAASVRVDLSTVKLNSPGGQAAAAKAIAQAQVESLKREYAERVKLMELKRKDLQEEAARGQKLADNYKKRVNQGFFKSIFTEGLPALFQGNLFRSGDAVQEQLDEQEGTINESLERQKKLVEEIQALKSDGTPVEQLEELLKKEQQRLVLLTAIDERLLNMERRRRKAESDNAVRGVIGFTPFKELKADLLDITIDTDILGEKIKELQALDAGADNKILDENIKEYNEELDKRIELEKEILKIVREQAQSTLAGALQRRSGFLERASQLRLEMQRGLDPKKSTFGSRIAEIDLTRSNLRQRIQENMRLMNQVSTGNSAADAGRVMALRKDTEENLNKLRDLELEKSLAILEAEKNIALERKKSADEAARALGTLSMEDKLRVQAQARFFAANPNRKLSLTDQFLGSEADNKIAQQFFEGRLDRFDPNSDPLARQLDRAGFGMTNDLINGQREVAQARNGRTDQQLMDEALRRSNQIDRQAGVVGGRVYNANIPQGTDLDRGGNYDAQGNLIPKVDVNVASDSFNLGPLVGAFERATGQLFDQKVQEMKEYVDTVVARKIRPNRPGTNI